MTKLKQAVVQGFTIEHMGKNEFELFWTHCFKSVKKWATSNDMDYHFFDKPIDPYDTSDLLNVSHEWRDAQARNATYYRWQWVSSLSDQYDVVYWIDGDTYVWGNPPPPPTNKKQLNHFNCMQCQKVADIPHLSKGWNRPNLSIFWGSPEVLREINDWYLKVLFNPSERNDLFITLKTLSESTKLVSDFTSEIALTAWIYENSDRTMLHPYICSLFPDVDTHWAYDSEAILEMCRPDSFLHFGGSHKVRHWQKFLAYRAYLSQISKG